MSKIFDELKRYGWPDESAEQLVFLYHYINDDKTFWVAVGSMGCMDADMIQQVIKCITHDMPCGPLLNNNLNSLQMNELRRFMEDTDCSLESPYWDIAMEISSLELDKDVIYEFRRFVKCENPLTYEQLNILFSFIKRYVQGSWMVIASMYDVYQKYGFDKMMEFGNRWANEVYSKNHHFTPEISSDMYEEAVHIDFN